jgi:zinc finger CCHC domain-containing protein 9
LSEARRLKRIAGRRVHTTCFACREVGHSAKDCPTILQVSERAPDRGDDDDDDDETKPRSSAAVKVVVGICYRCGSRNHNLARCRQPANPDDPLPFARCFVCSGRGHLASSCPQNSGKGVYPNGGSCKLCGETTHLARDCALRKTGPHDFPLVISSDRFWPRLISA